MSIRKLPKYDVHRAEGHVTEAMLRKHFTSLHVCHLCERNRLSFWHCISMWQQFDGNNRRLRWWCISLYKGSSTRFQKRMVWEADLENRAIHRTLFDLVRRRNEYRSVPYNVLTNKCKHFVFHDVTGIDWGLSRTDNMLETKRWWFRMGNRGGGIII